MAINGSRDAALGAPPPSFLRRHSSLALGIFVAVLTAVVLASVPDVDWRLTFVGAFDAGALVTLLALYVKFRDSSYAKMKQDAVAQDVGQLAVLTFVLVAAFVALVVIAAEMPRVREAASVAKFAHAFLVVFTIALSWTFMNTVFALHYAHDYFVDVAIPKGSAAKPSDRLKFPGGGVPTYSDFLYFSFTIGMTFQVSDVEIADAAIRRRVLVHGVLAFFFTTGILALTINLVAGLI